MVKVFNLSAEIYHKNEFMKDTTRYEQTYHVDRQEFGESEEEVEQRFRANCPEQDDKYQQKKITRLDVEYVCAFEWNEQGKAPLCGNDPDTGEHWSWYGNHEHDCPHAND